MFATIAEQSRVVNPLVGGVPAPSPRGFQDGYAGRMEQVDNRLFAASLPPNRWTLAGDGVGSTAVVPVQISTDDATWVEMQPITVLRNGRLRVGDLPHALHLVGLYEAGDSAVSRYELRLDGFAAMSLRVHVENRVAESLWERIYESDIDLYAMFESLMDGVGLDPLQLTAVFQSQASCIVFRRLFPEHTTLAVVRGELCL
jgi:hypothetical protein